MERLSEQATAALSEMSEASLVEVLPELNHFGDEVEQDAIAAVDNGDAENETVYIGLTRDELDSVILTSFVMGLIFADSVSDQAPSLVVGISPEQATDITRGLFSGGGATIRLAVVSDVVE